MKQFFLPVKVDLILPADEIWFVPKHPKVCDHGDQGEQRWEEGRNALWIRAEPEEEMDKTKATTRG